MVFLRSGMALFVGDFLVQEERKAGEAGEGVDGEGRSTDAVNALTQCVWACELESFKLIGKKGIANFPTVRFAVNKNAHLKQVVVFDKESGGDGLHLSNGFKDPCGAFTLLPISHAQAWIVLSVNFANAGFGRGGKPEYFLLRCFFKGFGNELNRFP